MAKFLDFKNHVSRLIKYVRDMPALARWVIILRVWPDFVMSNLQTFLTESLGFSTTTAAVIVNGHDAFSGISAIIGAFLGDVYLTHYAIIFLSSLFYLCGLILLAFVSVFVDVTGNIIISRWLVGVGLLLVGMGNFSLTNSAHDLSGRGDRIRIPQNLIKFVFEAAILLLLVIPEIFGSGLFLGWFLYFLISANLMGLITFRSFFHLKNNFRKPMNDRWTLLNLIPRTFITSMMKYLLQRPNDTLSLIDNRFLEISEITESSEPVPPQSSCAITQVEGDKRLLRMVSMCLAFLAYGLVKSIGDTFFLDQASDMPSSFNVPVQAFIYLAAASRSLTVYLYKKMIFNRLPWAGKKYSPAIQYAMGMVFSALCCTTASWVAMSRYQQKDTISVLRLSPQFAFFGAMDGLAEEGIEQFFSEQLPSSMRNYAIVFTQGIIGAGSVFAIILVLVTRAASNWFKDDKNLRLDQFYHLLTVVGIGIFFGYTLVAVKYRYQDIEEDNQVEDQNQREEPNLIQREMGLIASNVEN